ncbi:double-stranded RNA-binding protein 2-like [Bidens hawaiensis]|uniref:double-stranded RNA-binding protein 2-like n=1 Tax=Bidens hawaiensis TaxID=980011 RepID=UPI00404A43D4
MYKNQLQELAQRSCFNLPSYTCIREGPDHAPRFKATVNFNGETFESPNYCTTLRQAEHSAAEVALGELASQGPSNSLAARILDETGVYKNLLQEVSQRVGSSLPTYTTFRSCLGRWPVFTCTVELAGCIFTGEQAKNKKQAEKNAAMSAWSSLKLLTEQSEGLSLQKGNAEEQEHVIVARALQKFRLRARMSNIPFPIRFQAPRPKAPNGQPSSSTTSKILPLICPKMDPSKHHQSNTPQTCTNTPQKPFAAATTASEPLSQTAALPRPHRFPAVEADPYIPVCQLRAPPVTMRNSIPVFSAPPTNHFSPQFVRPSIVAPSVTIRHAVPVFAAPIKPATAPTEVKSNTGTYEDFKSPLAMSALPAEDEEGNAAVVCKDGTKLDFEGLQI